MLKRRLKIGLRAHLIHQMEIIEVAGVQVAEVVVVDQVPVAVMAVDTTVVWNSNKITSIIMTVQANGRAATQARVVIVLHKIHHMSLIKLPWTKHFSRNVPSLLSNSSSNRRLMKVKAQVTQLAVLPLCKLVVLDYKNYPKNLALSRMFHQLRLEKLEFPHNAWAN